jgi:arylsulfatase A-like enzyme
VNTPIHIIDWLPTLLDVAHAKAPDSYQLDGLSLLPVLKGKDLPMRSLLWYMPLYDLRWGATPCAVLRSKEWKLIEYFGDRFDNNGKYEGGPHVELFNLSQDLSETTNLASHDSARKQAMLDELHSLLHMCHAEIPGENPHHDKSRPLTETKAKPDFLK